MTMPSSHRELARECCTPFQTLRVGHSSIPALASKGWWVQGRDFVTVLQVLRRHPREQPIRHTAVTTAFVSRDCGSRTRCCLVGSMS